MQAWVVGEITTAEWGALADEGHQIFKLPLPVARHFVAPLQQKRGTSVVALRVEIEPINLLTYAADLDAGLVKE